ncbi:MAG TPA: hypothetical protein DGG95_10630 [Cytophagales bacterium]|jgi:hypothetical protein|nr:hypothetical protein [Cytophagales bacterium]
MIRIFFLFSTLNLILTSCDCVVHHEGFVLDSETEKPIVGATIKFANKRYKTDSIGYFKIHYVTGFCPDWEFVVEKENYHPEHLLIDLDENERNYKIKESDDKSSYHNHNSFNFKIKEKKIYFLLTKI